MYVENKAGAHPSGLTFKHHTAVDEKYSPDTPTYIHSRTNTTPTSPEPKPTTKVSFQSILRASGNTYNVYIYVSATSRATYLAPPSRQAENHFI